ncbi:MAG: cytochrome c biogenesis protein CcsA [Anaerolineae bacterium]|nr:cytochrome c biogenesis protein CcsA [Anaerolineae bacterium]
MMVTLAYFVLLLALAIGFAVRKGIFDRLPALLSAFAWALLSAGLAQRGWEAGHWPIAGRYEFALCWVWAILALSLLLVADQGRVVHAYLSPWPLAAAALVFTYALAFPDAQKAIAPLSPVLRSPWLQIHVLSALLAYGAAAVAAGLAVERLLAHESPLERPALRMVAIGFTWLTLSILAGMVWAQGAWGRYWDWDIKEVWALGTWLWYLFLLHAHPFLRRREQRLAWLIIAGFALVSFTFAGVPWLVHLLRLETLHGY